MNRQQVENWVESLCEKGCRSVWDDIRRLENGDPMPGMESLSPQDLEQILVELKAIMAVYGENGCDADLQQTTAQA